VTWLRVHWTIVAGVLCALALGLAAGWAVGKRRGEPSATVSSCDAGVQAYTSLAFSFDAGPSKCSCDAGTTVRVKPLPPVLVYLPGDAGPCLEVTQEDVTIDTNASASATTGAVAVSVAVDAGAMASASATASVVLGGSQARTWDFLAGPGFTTEGKLDVTVGAVWHPGGGDLGLGVVGNIVPNGPSSGVLLLDLRR